jgi:hypothetical protein
MLKEETELWLDLGWISLRCRGCVGGRLYGTMIHDLALESLERGSLAEGLIIFLARKIRW